MSESTSMSRHVLPFAAISLFAAAPAAAQTQVYAPRVYATQVEIPSNVRYATAPQRQMGGGFIEFLFNSTGEPPRAHRAVPADPYVRDPYVNRGYDPEPALASRGSVFGYPQGEPARPAMDPRYLPQTVSYDGRHAPGTNVIDAP